MRNSLELDQSGLKKDDLRDRVISVFYAKFREKKSEEQGSPPKKELGPEFMGFSVEQLEGMKLREFTYGSKIEKRTVNIADYQFLKVGQNYMIAALIKDIMCFDVESKRLKKLFSFNTTKELLDFWENQLTQGSFFSEPVFELGKFGGMDEHVYGRKSVSRYTPFYLDVTDPVHIHNIYSMGEIVNKEIIVLEEE